MMVRNMRSVRSTEISTASCETKVKVSFVMKSYLGNLEKTQAKKNREHNTGDGDTSGASSLPNLAAIGTDFWFMSKFYRALYHLACVFLMPPRLFPAAAVCGFLGVGR